MRCNSLCTRSWVALLACWAVVACGGGSDPRPEPRPILQIAQVQVLTENPQAGHPIELRALIQADEETEDVGVTFYLERVDPVPAQAGDGEEENTNRTVLDSILETVVPALIQSNDDPERRVGHEIVAKMTVPTEVTEGIYFIYASIDLMPFNEADPQIENYNGRDQDCTIEIGDDLKYTPDLVIGDVRAKTEVVVLDRAADQPAGDDSDDPPGSHWTGTVLVTSFGAVQTEDATISALLEIPGKPLRPIKIWNTHEYVQVWRNDGEAAFKDTLQRLKSSEANDVQLADIDADGDLDLVSGNGNPGEDEDPRPNRVWLNDSTGSFVDSGQVLGESFTFSIALGDIDGDDDLDFVAGNADGASGQPDRIWINEGGRGFFAAGAEIGSGNTYAVRLADLDGDADLDLITAGDETHIWLNDGLGNFEDSGISLDTGAVRAIAVGHVNADGLLDLVTAGPASAIWINEGGSFTKVLDLGSSLLSVALGDLDLDLDLDLIGGLEGGGVVVWKNTLGAFAPAGGPFGSEHGHDLAIGDLNGDGLNDFVAGNDGAAGVEEPDRVWVGAGPGSDGNFVFDEGQELGGSDTRAVVLGNIDSDGDLDLVSGNLGLPDRIEGEYVDDLSIAALKPNTPTRVQIDLHIPEMVDGVDLYQEIDDYVQSSGSVYFNVIFCIDRYDDIPEHEGSALDPERPNDNCVVERLIILPPPPEGQIPNEFAYSNDAEATWGGKLIGIGVKGHFEGNMTKAGIQQRVEQTVPFTLFGWTLDVMKLTSDARKVPDNPKDSRHQLDLEFAGITIVTSEGEGPSEEDSEDKTEGAEITVTFSVCLPPPIYELEIASEKFEFGTAGGGKVEGEGGKTEEKKDEPEKDENGEPVKKTPKNDDASDADDKGDGAKPDKKVAKKKTKVNEGYSGDFDCGWVKVIPVGPFPLTIRIGGTGKIGFKIKLNPDDPFDPEEAGRDVAARIQYKFEPLASTDGFVFAGLELSLGILKAQAGVAAKLLIVEYGYDVDAHSAMIHNPASPTDSGGRIYDVYAQFKVTELFRSLRGEVFLFIKIAIVADIGLFELKVEWTFKHSLFKFKGIEQKDVLVDEVNKHIAAITTFR